MIFIKLHRRFSGDECFVNMNLVEMFAQNAKRDRKTIPVYDDDGFYSGTKDEVTEEVFTTFYFTDDSTVDVKEPLDEVASILDQTFIWRANE